MKIALPELLDRARDLARNELLPRAEEVDRTGTWPERQLRALLAADFGGLVVPEADGGIGHGMLGLARVCEELGKACSSTALCFGMHGVASAVLAAKPTAEQRRRLLEPICSGAHLTTLALSEPETGVHFYFPRMQMTRDADGSVHVRGTKSFVTNGGHADSYVLNTVAPTPDAGRGAFSCLVLPADTPGVSFRGPWAGFGMRGNSARTLDVDARTGPENLLGQEGDELWYVFQVVAPYFLAGMAGTYLGIAATALEEARMHLSGRLYSHSGGSLSGLAVLQHRLGRLWSSVEASRQLLYHATALADSGSPDALPAILSSKAEVADCAVEVCNEVMTLMGGRAYGAEARVARLLRDARAAHVMAPTTDVLRTWAGRALLGVPLLGD